VRRRFGDEDPVGKLAAQALERALSYSIDDYDFDATMEAVIHDSLLPGRGAAIVIYDAVVNDDSVDYEAVRCEPVHWDDLRIGPARKWADVPWIAIRYRITREEAIGLNAKIGATVSLDYVEKGADKPNEGQDPPDIFKRLTVWKIWDKAQRQIVYIAPSYKDGPLRTDNDDLKLRDFFPMPRPIYDVFDSNSLVPQVPYDKYRDQAEELDRITKRLKALINVLRWRGIRPSQIEELDKLKDADDGDLIPSQSFDALMMTQGASADKAIWLMPIERLIEVIRELVVQREAIKQVVFEISGLADIMRGETNPNETLGAQQIKAQWGSLRMQRRQRDVQRFARDLMRIKAEIIGEHFSVQTLQAMTGINLPTAEQKAAAQMQMQQQPGQPPAQPPPEVAQVLASPTWEDVKTLMASDALRGFRIDIETDSTIQADQTRNMQTMTTFVEGLGGFITAIAPAVQEGVMPMDVAADMLTAMGRNFRLGKQFEDALDRLGKEARQPKPPKADPEMVKAQADAQAKQADQQHQQQMQALQTQHQQATQAAEAEHQRNMQMADLQHKQAMQAVEFQHKQSIDAQGMDMKRQEMMGTEAGQAADVLQKLGEGLSAVAQMAQEASDNSAKAVEEVGRLLAEEQAEASAPIEVIVHRQNGRPVGATKRQGRKVTEITLQ
jgi:hypothetical protein